METAINCVSYDAPVINRKEILRYLKTDTESKELNALIDEALEEVSALLTYKVCYCTVPIIVDGDCIDFGGCRKTSRDLAKNLKGCHSAVIFAATVGIKIDMLINKYSKVSPAKALVLQAIGNERIESLCNTFNQDITAEYRNTKPRFSPGYGDLDLEMQLDIFRILDCSRKIGLSLQESLLMCPQKSVTAIIGVA